MLGIAVSLFVARDESIGQVEFVAVDRDIGTFEACMAGFD